MFPIAPPFLCAKSGANMLDPQLVSGKTTFVKKMVVFFTAATGKLVPRNFGPEVDIDPAPTLFFASHNSPSVP